MYFNAVFNVCLILFKNYQYVIIILIVSFQFTGPFLHLFGIVTLTALSWYVAGGLGTLKKRGKIVQSYIVTLLKHCY